MLFNNNKNCDSKQRFGIRKLSVGVCSVLLSTLFLTMNSPEVVHADSDKDVDPNANQPEIAEVATTSSPDDTNKAGPAEAVKNNIQIETNSVNTNSETQNQENTTSNSNDHAASEKADEPKTESLEKHEENNGTNPTEGTVDDNKEKNAPEVKETSGAIKATENNEVKDSKDSDQIHQSTSPKTDGETENNTNTLVIGKNKTPINADALKASKVNTTDKTINWGNHRFIMDWDWQTHDNDYWNARIQKEVMPWVLKEDNNEGATFKSWEWTSQGTQDGDNWKPNVDDNQGFAYPAGNLVVENPNGKSTTTYTGITINVARSIASYFRCKYGIVDTTNNEQTPVSDTNSQNTYITVHANSENPFTQVIPNSSIDKIVVGGWTYGTQGDNAQQSRDYLISLIKEIKLTDVNISQNGKIYGQFAIKFTDNSVLQGKQGTITVVGGVAQTGLTVAKGANFSLAYPNANSGITTDSQNKIAQWTPDYEWVYDANGTPLDASHQYNTKAPNFDAYVKINYKQDGKADGYQIVKVPVTVILKVEISGNGTQTETYNGSAFNSSILKPDNFKLSFNDADDNNKQITNLTPTTGNELTSSDYEINGNPTNVGSYDVCLNANGIAKVKKWNNANNYDWSNISSANSIKVGTFTIKKAKPTVTFNGKGSKTYDGQPLSSSDYTTAIGLSYENAAGMGDQTISLTAGTDYVWYLLDENDHKTGNALKEAPAAVGKYTIELTTDGIDKIKGSSINSANLDWANATVKTATDTSYVINKADTKVNFEGNNDSSKPTYNGSAVSMPSLDTLKDSMSATNNVTGHNVDFSKLTAADFDWYESPTTTEAMKSAPINAGTYYIKLNGKGLSDLKDQNLNYKITQGTNLYKFTIDKKTLTDITFSGNDGKTYNGSAGSIDATKAGNWSATGLIAGRTLNTSGLTNADFSWSNGSAPTNVSDTPASIVLNADGLAKLLSNNSNYTFTQNDVKGKITYTITQANGTVSIKNTTPDNYFKPYDGQPTNSVDMSKLTVTAADGSTSVIDFSTTGLTDADFEFVDAQGNALTEKPTAVGTYSIKLTDAGLTKLNKVNPNYKLTYDNSLATYKINAVTLTVEQDGSSNKTYTGSSLSPELADVLKALEATGLVGNEKLNTEGITLEDFAWTGNDPTHTNADFYELKLNADGLKKLQDNNKNYTISSVDGKYTFTIDKATATINITGIDSKYYDGDAAAINSTKFTPSVSANSGNISIPSGTTFEAKDFEFVGSDGTVYAYDKGPTEIDDYKIQLSAAGLAKVETDKANYDWVNGTFGTYTISKNTVGTITINDVNGGQSVNYKGSQYLDKDIDVSNYNLTLPKGFSYTLQAGDLAFVADTNATNARTYHIVLSATGKANLNKANSNYSFDFDKADTVKGQGTFTINKIDATATFEGKGEKTYNGQPLASTDYTTPIGVKTNNALGTTANQFNLTAGTDYVWKKDGKTYTSASSDAGTYTIELTTAGINKIKGINNTNLNWTVSGSGSYVINQADVTVALDGNNDSNKPKYTGSAVSMPVNDLQGAMSGTGLDFSKLTAADFDWYESPNASAPINAGTYYIKLNGKGLSDLQAQNSNYNYKQGTNLYTFTIDKASAIWTLSGHNVTKNYDGKAVTVGDTGMKVTLDYPGIKDADKNFTFTSDDYTITDGNNQTVTEMKNAGTYTISLSQAGKDKIAKINSNNVTWTGSGSITVTIKKATVKGDVFEGNVTINYGETPNFDNKYTATLVPTDSNTITGFDANYVVPQGSYLQFKRHGSNEKWSSNVPTTVGTYDVILNTDGWNALKDAKNSDNIQLSATGTTFTKNTATFVITPVTLTVKQTGSHNTPYTGSPLSPELSDVLSGIKATGLANNESLNTTGLTFKDFDWTAKTDAGSYELKLNDAGLKKLQDNNTNYTINSVDGKYTFTIDKAVPTATISGTASKTYDGSAITGYKPSISITAPGNNTVSLEAGTDYVWVKDGKQYTSAPSDAGNYKIQLTTAGETKIKGVNAQNLDWSKVTIGNDTSYVISKRDITVTENGSETAKYDGTSYGDKDGIDTSNFVPTLTTTDNVAVPNISGISWDAATDFVVKDGKGNTLTADQIKNAGSYSVYLTDTGLNKLKDVKGASNFNWPASVTTAGKFTIKSAEASATISSLTGRTYDGKATTSSDLNAVASITVPGTDSISYTLVDGDYTWNTTDHAAPINASDTAYTITLTNAGVEHLQKAINDKIGADNVTIANTDVTNKVSYKIDKATATVNFANGSGQTVDYTGQTGKFNASKFTPDISTNNGQTLSIPSGVQLSLANGDFTINGVKATTEPTALGEYTIGLSDTGFANLQSATNNYNWVNNAKATYVIRQNASSTVTLNGNQDATYTGSAYSNDDIDVSKFTLTLPEGMKSYTLQKGDLEFVSGNPTTVGSYQVRLSKQGKESINKFDPNFSFDFNKDGVVLSNATFTITKATPTVTFHGEGSKTFAQNNTQWSTNVGLTITAPGATNPTIALANGDYQFVLNSDHSVTSTTIPTNVGEYTIEITDQGKNKIVEAKGTGLNVENLDWANAKISGTGKFIVNAAQASAKLSGSNSRDYNGSAVTTADINNGGNIVVSISIPGTDKTVSYKLQDGDYTWTKGTDPINQGSYTLELNKAKVLAHLQDQIDKDSAWKGNVTIAETALSGEATFTIKKVNASAQLQNGDSRKYNGSSTSISDVLSQLQNGKNWNTSGFVNNEKIDTSTLTVDGFDWYKADGTTKLTEDPKTVGNYVIKLNSKGISELQNANGNYTFTPNGQFTYEITKANGTVKFSGEHTITYGQSDPDYYKHYSLSFTTDPTISGFTPSYKIKAGDLQFSTDGQNWKDTVPTSKGNYQVRLDPSILEKLDNAANIDWSQTGTGTYIVNAATATASLSGSAKRPYNGSAVTINDINNTDSTIGVTINLPNGKTTTYKLVAGDYTWTKGSVPTNVGTYQLKFNLTNDGKAHLQNWLNQAEGAGFGLDNKPNVLVPTEVTGKASFEITPVAITVTQSGSNSKTYDGNAANVTVADLTNNNNWSTSGMIGGQHFNIPEGMALSDFDWYKVNADGSESKINAAPTDAGNYALKLNDAGLKKLQDANKNYSFSSVDKQYNYVINQANAEISLNETTNKQSATWDGNQISLDLSKFIPAIKDTSNNKDISYPTSVALTAGDYTITQKGQAVTAQEPGTYQIQLTEQGWQKVRDAISGHDNYKWTYSGNGVLTISQKTQAITISGSNNVVYSGSSAVIPTDNNGNLIGYTVNLGNGLTYQLKAGDLAFVDAEHINVGPYKLKLTDAGLDNIKKFAEGNHYNYQYTYDADNTATLTVDKATATYALSGNQNSTYNGSPASIDLNKDNSYSIAIKMNNGQNVTYQLKTEDLAFKSGSNPTARGKYDVVLSAAGLQHLKAINANYTWDIDKSTSTAFYEINPAEMFVGLGGETDSVFNNAIQPVPSDKLSNLHIVWGGSDTKPSDVANTIQIQARDFDYYIQNADGSFTKVDPTKGPKDAGRYYLFLNDAGLKRLSDANSNGNYTFAVPTEQNSKNAATYTINQLAAKVTLTGEQTAEYGYAQELDPSKFTVTLKDKDGKVIAEIKGTDLKPGDLLIKNYSADKHPDDVGTYDVEIQKQLMDKLKKDFPDFDFKEIVDEDSNSDGISKSVSKKNNNGIYVITTIDANIAISGRQEVSYNSKNSYSIDNSKYSVTLTDKYGKPIDIPDDIKSKLEFKFVTNPTDAGNYEVTLTPDSLKAIESIGANHSNHLNNYAWLTDNIKAQPYVVTPLQVTATVSNKSSEPASSIYGQSINLDDHLNEYTITLVDKTTGQPITYTLQKGDLEFVNGKPTTTGEFAVRLSQVGIDNIEKQYPTKNYTITFDHTATYNVIAATPTVTITANGDSQKTYNAQPAEIKSGDFTVSIKTNNGQTINVTLNSADLEFDGSAPTNVGQYDVKLKRSVIDQLKRDHPNYDWDAVKDAVGKYTITAADGSAKLSGDVTKPYDGSGISDLSPIKVTVDYPGVGSNTTYTLTNDDYVIVNDQTNKHYTPDKAPADVGSYHIELTATGKANIAKLGNTDKYHNINWTAKSYTGEATYKINAISISVSGQGKQEVTYDGTAFGNEDKLDLSKFVPTLNAGNVSVPEIPAGTLTADDYTIKNSKGETVTDPTNSGDYTVWLNENGLNKLKKLSSNFTWPTDPIKVGTLNINQTDVTAKLSGSNSKTYDGKAVSTQDINKVGGNITIQVTVNGKTYDYALKDGDYTWANGEAPTNVGEYKDKIVLDTTGKLKSHLTEFINGQNKDLEGNFKIDATNLTGSASFNIIQKDATVTQGGSDDTKTYNGTAGSVTLDQLINNLTSSGLVSGQNLNTSGLTLDDFAWSGPDKDHIAAGDYTISLTDAGLAKLQADNSNYKLTVTGSFKYTIKQATASAELSGSGEKTYNGDPVSDSDIQKSDKDNNITVKVTIPGVKDPQTVTLGVNDFDWTGPDKDHIAAGTYTLTLNDAGKAAIKDKFADNKNIDWTKTSFNGSATYTIKKADGKIEFTGSDSKDFDNKEVLPSDLDGNKFYVTVNGQQIALPQNGYEFVDANGKKATPKDAGTYYVVLTADGLKELEKDTNYSWTPNWNGTTRPNQIGTFVINQTKVTPTISGSNDKTYNGSETKLAEVTKDGKIKVTVDSGNTEFTIPDYVLTADDYDWYGADGNKISVPTNVGHYFIKLSTQGLQNIQAYLDKTYGKDNVALDTTKNSGQAAFDINPFEITVTIDGSATVDAGTTTIPDGKYNFDFVPTNKDDKLPNGWTKPTILVSDLEFDGQAPTGENKDGIFTVNYKGGQEALQKLLGDNYKVTYVAGKDNYVVKSVSVPSEPDNPTPPSQPTDAKPTQPSDQKPDNKPDTKPSKPGKPDKPNKPGKPEKPNKPSKPNKPNKPSKPSKPAKPNKTETTKPGQHATKAPNRSHYTSAALAENGEKRSSTNTTPPNGSDVPKGFPAGTHWKNGMLIGPAGEVYYKNGHWTRVGEHALPQTGAHNTMLATVFGSLASGLGILGLLGVHKKKKDEEEN